MTKNQKFPIPELLAPAGSLEKLKTAVLYGAGAVYLGGQKFGLRAAADNFNQDQLRKAVSFAHAHGSKVNVVLNAFLHDSDFVGLSEFASELKQIGVDAVIVSDLGVIKTVLEAGGPEVHLSTQASCLNASAAKLWKSMGVSRVVLGREASLSDAAIIKKESGLEVEMFVHGSMCMAFSGHCVISNYTQGRDSNRGGCAHSCRHEYKIALNQTEQEKNAFFMSSKDLEGLRLLKEYVEAGVDCLKIEGRMKSVHYAGTVTKVYAEALAHYQEHGNFLSDRIEEWASELRKVHHRAYTQASLVEPAGQDSIHNGKDGEGVESAVAGPIVAVTNDAMVIEVRRKFHEGEELELVPFKGPVQVFKAAKLRSLSDTPLSETKPGSLVKIALIPGASEHVLVRSTGL